MKKHLTGERWLLIERDGFTGRRLHRWLRTQGWVVEPATELDSFDFIANLVSLGLGVSLVPHRVLALYGHRRAVQRIATRPRFSRELAVVVRRNRVTPEPLRSFVENIFFNRAIAFVRPTNKPTMRMSCGKFGGESPE